MNERATPDASPDALDADRATGPSSAPAVVEVGDQLDEVEVTATLGTSVAYAGASGDLNPLHFDQDFAGQVSPTGGIIAHGMYSMGLASRVLTAFAGGPEHVVELSVRFTRPWPLGTTARFGGKVTAVDDDVATVSLFGQTDGGDRVLRGTGRIRVRPTVV